MKKTLTIQDIANHSGVAKVTVSRVINNSSKVTARTRKKVLATMARLNYVPDVRARGLATNKTYLLGLVYYDNPNALYIADIQKGALRTSLKYGYEIIMHPVQDIRSNVNDDVKRFVERTKVDGVVLVSPISQLNDLVAELDSIPVNVVRMSAREIDAKDRVVVSQDRLGEAMVTEHLIELGHSRIAFVTGPKTNVSAQEKLRGYQDSLARHGIPLRKRLIVQGDYTIESGFAAGLKLIERKAPPTAVVAANDQTALGVLKAARVRSVDVPGELSVVGYDDSTFCRVVWPELTSVRQSLDGLGELAAAKLVAQLSASPIGLVEVDSPAVVVRGSTGPPPT